MSAPAFELAEIIHRYKASFLQTHPQGLHQLKTLHALEICRTAQLGGHIDRCSKCEHIRISYNSCRNRHCPKCQGTNRERWMMQRENDLLPVKYFHVVFTLPQEFNIYCMHHPAEMYEILFQASRATIEVFSNDKKHLGAQSGMISLLHTWGQNLSLHPHIHMIVPGGGFTEMGYWKSVKRSFLFPVKAMAQVYRGKFMELFLSWARQKKKNITYALRNELYTKNWVVYAKPSFKDPSTVIEYLGRYTHKIAISNHRILSIANEKITFSYKDYADGARKKTMTLSANEFLRRFCMHILPKGFRKIRHYGFLASRNKPRLREHRLQIGIPSSKQKNRLEIHC